MKHLCILKIDQNPLEWPPPHIAEMPLSAKMALPVGGNASAKEVKEGKRTEERVMNMWIRQMKSWMSESLAHERQAQAQSHNQQINSTPPPSSSGSSTSTVSVFGAAARRAARENPGSGGSMTSVGVAPSVSWNSNTNSNASPQQPSGRAGPSYGNDHSHRPSLDRSYNPNSNSPTSHSPSSSASPLQDRSYMKPLAISSSASPASNSGFHHRHAPSSSLSMSQSMTSSDSTSSSQGTGFGSSNIAIFRGNQEGDSSGVSSEDNSQAYDESSLVGEKAREEDRSWSSSASGFKATRIAPQPPNAFSSQPQQTSRPSTREEDISPKSEWKPLGGENEATSSRPAIPKETESSKEKEEERKDSTTSEADSERERTREKKNGRMPSPLRSRSGSGGRSGGASETLSPATTNSGSSTIKASPIERHASPPPPLPNNSHMEPLPPMPAQYSTNSPLTSSPKAQFSDFLPEEKNQPSSNVGGEEVRLNRPKLSINSSTIGHGRNNSHTVGMTNANDRKVASASAVRPGLKSKKSLPDMRLGSAGDVLYKRDASKAEAVSPSIKSRPGDPMERADTMDSNNSSEDQASSVSSPHGSRRPSASQKSRPPLPNIQSNVNSNLNQSNSPSSTGSPTTGASSSSSIVPIGGSRKYSLPSSRAPSNLATREGRSESVSSSRPAAFGVEGNIRTRSPSITTRNEQQQQPQQQVGGSSFSNVAASGGVASSAPVDVERNSYFRRLSTLPPSTISKAVPVPVLKFVDATRGVLFALSQIYMALKQYILFTSDERVAAQFNKVLDVASASMAELINSLDRFDSLSRRASPEPKVIYGVLKAGRDSVGTFRKVVAVLQLQLRTLQSSADVRYTRTLLLMLYGSMAEVGNSWQEMAPQVDAVLIYLAQGGTSPSGVKLELTSTTMNKTSSNSTQQGAHPTTLPSIAEGSSPAKDFKPTALPPRSQRRRHAGSFSAHDVAQGAAMNPNLPNSASSVQNDESQPFNLQEVQAQSLRNRNFSSGQASPPTTPGIVSAGAQSYNFPEIATSSATPAYSGNSISTPKSATTPSSRLAQPQEALGRRRSPSGEPQSTPASSSTFNREIVNNRAGVGRDTKLLVDVHTIFLVKSTSAAATGVCSLLSDHLSSFFASDESQDLNLSQPAVSKKLKELKDLGSSTADMTKRLQSTLLRVKDELIPQGIKLDLQDENDLQHQDQTSTDDGSTISISKEENQDINLPITSEIRKLNDESHRFARLVISMAQLLKVASQEHTFPREVRSTCGVLTVGCGNLLLHMGSLNPSTPGAKTTVVNVSN